MKIFDCYEKILKENKHCKQRIRLLEKYQENINEEINNLIETVDAQNKIIIQIKKDLSELNGIEYNLYSKIIVDGLNISKAIEKVAEEERKDISTIWKNYYPKIKHRLYLIEKLNNEKEEKYEEN